MKRSMILFASSAVAICLASPAVAEVITAYSTDSGASEAVATFDVTRTYNATFGLDEVVFAVDSWLASGYTGAEINALSGTWSASGVSGAGLYLATPAYDWSEETCGYVFKGMYYTPDAPQSYVNMDSLISNAVWSRTLASGDLYGDFHGGWYASSGDYTRGVGEVLAVMYVSPNADVTFTAAGDPDGLGTTSGTFKHCTFTTGEVPEPATLTLLACGLFGLLAYAWRKRK